MSIQSNSGAQSAAESIAAFVKKRLAATEALELPLPLRALAQAELEGVLKHAEEIRDAAKAGWY